MLDVLQSIKLVTIIASLLVLLIGWSFVYFFERMEKKEEKKCKVVQMDDTERFYNGDEPLIKSFSKH